MHTKLLMFGLIVVLGLLGVEDVSGVTLSNNAVSLQISASTGQVVSGTYSTRAEKCLGVITDEYALDSKAFDASITASEAYDRVVSTSSRTIKGVKTCTLECENTILSRYGVSLTKIYRLSTSSSGKFSKEVIFHNNSASSGYWVHYNNYTRLTPTLRNGSYYYVPFMDRKWASEVSETVNLTSRWYGPHTNENCAVINPVKGYGICGYIYKINNRFVSSFAVGHPPTGSYAVVALEKDGFRLGSDVAFVLPGDNISVTFQWDIFEGDTFEYLSEYYNLPELAAMRRKYKNPSWMEEASVLGFGSINPGYLGEYYENGWWKEFTDLLKWGYYPIYFDNYGDSHGDYNRSDHPDDVFFKRYASLIHKDIPKVKIGIYVPWDGWASGTEVYAGHPEYFVYDRDGKIVHSIYTRYAIDITQPGCYKHFANGMAAMQEHFNLDFISIDGGAGPVALWGKVRNWGYKGAVPSMMQWYDWYDLFRDTITDIQSKNPQVGFHNNQPSVLQAGIAMMEMPGHWGPQADWRPRSDLLYASKMGETADSWMTPLSWHVFDGNGNPLLFEDFCYAKMLFMLALRPTMAFHHVPWSGDAIFIAMKNRTPWANAVYEMRRAKLVDAGVSPWWYAEPEGSESGIEAYTLRQGADRFITVCNHGSDRPVKVSVDRDLFKLARNTTTFVWENSIMNPNGISSPPTSVVAQKTLLVLRPPVTKKIEISTPINNEDIRVFNLTQVPGFIAEVEGSPTEFNLVNSLDIAISGSIDHVKIKVALDAFSSKRKRYKIAAYCPKEWGSEFSAAVDGQAASYKEIILFKERFLIVDIKGVGLHKINIERLQ